MSSTTESRPITVDNSPRRLTAPIVGTGAFMALYLLLRPYGDVGDVSATAEAFASNRWLAAHLFGALALASFARLTVRVADHLSTVLAHLARTFALVGTVLALLYYGAETFALHALGRAALAGNPAIIGVADEIRFQGAAVIVFTVGLALVSVAAILLGIAGRRLPGMAWTVWPLAVTMCLFPAQFYLPVAGRIVFGLVTAVAATIMLIGIHTAQTRPTPTGLADDLPRSGARTVGA